MTTLPALTAGTALQGSELFYVAQSSADRKLTASQLKEYVAFGGGVSVKQFGATGDGTTDDTAAIQAAIDFGIANSIRVIFLPKGRYKITSSLYMDPPSSLRASSSVSSYSLTLQGEPSGPAHEGGGGSTIYVGSGYNFPAVIVGPGRSQSIRNIIFGTDATGSRASKNTSFYAVVLSQSGSQFLMSECRMENYHGGVKTGFNGVNLTDSNTFFKCYFENLYIGLRISGHQNYINTMIDCTCEQVKISVLSEVGKAVNILGGNYSLYNNHRGVFTISSVSTFTGSDNNTYRFTATVSSPDTYFASGDYDLFCLYHTNWGPIPLRKTAYSAGVITFKVEDEWLFELMGSQNDLKSATTLEADIQTCTTLYAAEGVTTFSGTGIHASGVHVENPLAVTTVLDHVSGFGGDTNATVENVFFDWDQSGGGYSGATGAELGLWYLQQVTPMVRVSGGKVTLRNWTASSGAGESNIFTTTSGDLIVESCDPTIINPELWANNNVPEFTGYYQTTKRRGSGFGYWDKNYNKATSATVSAVAYHTEADGRAPNMGFFPAPHAIPRLPPSMLASYLAGSYAAGTLPPICGQSIYQVLQWDTGAPAKLWAKAAHKGYSWGANITVNWSYVAGSRCLNLSDTSLMFPGLVVSLNGNEYVVKSVHKLLGYVSVMSLDDANAKGVFKGTKGTTFTGTTLTQAAITFTQY